MPPVQSQQSCPRCGALRPADSTECGRCGIIFARYAAARVRPPPPAPTAAPKPHVSAAALERAFESLAQALSAGLTVRAAAAAGALDALPLSVARALRADAEAGLPLAQGLERLNLLDPGGRAVLRAAETRGALPEGLRLASAQLARGRTLRKRLLLGLAYPLFLLIAAILLLPLPVAFGPGGLTAYLARVVPLLLLVAGVVVGILVGLPRLRPSSPLRRAVAWVGARAPIAAGAVRSDALAAFLGVLGASLKAGLPARESLSLAAQSASPHPAFDGAAEGLLEALDRGATLAEALRRVPAMSALDLAQVGTAEVAGTLDEVLPALEARHRERARVMWLALAAVVGGAIFLGVVTLIVGQIVHGWAEIFRAQDEQIDRIMR